MKSTLKGIFMVTRPPLTIGGLLGALALLKWSGNIAEPTKAFFVCSAIFFASIFFNTLNEYADRETDAMSKKKYKKPIPSGKVTLTAVRKILAVSCMLMVYSCLFLAFFYSWLYLLFAIIGILSALVYDCVRKDLVGNLFMGIAYGMTALIPLYPKYPLFVVDFAIFTVSFNLLVQYQDLEAELAAGVVTAPQQLGKRGTVALSTSLALIVHLLTLHLHIMTQYDPLLIFLVLPNLLYASNYLVAADFLGAIEWVNRIGARIVLLLFFICVILI